MMKRRKSISGILALCMLCSSIPTFSLPANAVSVAGDVNNDNNFSLTDIVLMQQYIIGMKSLSGNGASNADFNNDGLANIFDLSLMKYSLMKSTPVTDTISIHLSDSGITVEGDTKGVVSVSDKTVTISASGSYKVDGSVTDGQILINVPDVTTDINSVDITMSDVTMTSSTGNPCIYTQSAAKTKIIAEGTNTLTDTSTTANLTTSGVIYCESDLTITKKSTGTLNISSSMNVGMYSKDDISLNGGTVNINTDIEKTSDADAIKAKNTVSVDGATVNIESSADGIKSTKDWVEVLSGSVNIKAGNDAIQGATSIDISGGTVIASGDRGLSLDDGGKLNITSGEVLATSTDYQITDSTTSLATVDLTGCTQGVMLMDYSAQWKKDLPIVIQSNGKTVFSQSSLKKFNYAIISTSGITSTGTYTTSINSSQLGHENGANTNFAMTSNVTEFYNVAETGGTVVNPDDKVAVSASFNNGSVTLLSQSGATLNSADNVIVSGETITITQPCTISITGKSTDAQVIVDVDKTTYPTGLVELSLEGAELSNSSKAPIFVNQIGDEVVVSPKNGTTNTISDGTSHTDTYTDSEGVTETVNGAIFARDDLKIKGKGTLIVNGNTEDGIVCKNDIKLYNGTLQVTAKDDGIRGNDSITIGNDTATDFSGLNITVTSTAGDGFKTKDTDTTSGKGYIQVNGGTVNVTSYSDAFHASQKLTVAGGDLTLKTTCPASQSSSGGWGGFQPGGGSSSSKTDISAKGLKAGCTTDDNTVIEGTINVTGGTMNIDSTDDSVHATNITIDGGIITASSGDDGVHADNTLIANNGEINVTKSYEGLEAADLQIKGGTVHVVSSDDGFNAAGGNDSSGNQGGWGQGGWGGGMSSSTGTLTISGGYVYVRAEGDGLDSNGNLTISGGTVLVCGPTSGGNGIFDKGDGSYTFSITGGTVWGIGTSDMFETPSSTYLSSSTSFSANQTFAAADSNGNVTSIMTVPSDMSMNGMVFFYSPSTSGLSLYSGGTYNGTLNSDGYGEGGTLSGGSALSSSSSGGGNQGNRPGGWN